MNNENERILSRKNTAAIEQALSALDDRISTHQASIDALRTTLNNFLERMNALETLLMMHKVKAQGTGPSVK